MESWRVLAATSALTVLVAAHGYGAVGSAKAPPTGAELLRGSAQAERLYEYRGSKRLVFHGGDHAREITLRVVHLRPDRTRLEFVAPEGVRGVRIEIGKSAWRLDPRSQQWRPTIARDPEAMDLTRLLANYTTVSEGAERVAGRRCYVVAIKPKQLGNPSRRVWIDAATKLPLRTQFYGADGDLISEASFTEIAFSVPRSAADLVRAPKGVTERPEPRPTPPFEPVKPAYVPPGYELVATSGLSFRGRVSCHLRYSDGLGAISLFEEKRITEEPERRREHPPGEGRERHRRERREFPSALRWEQGDMRFTLIGDISPQQLRKMAASLPGGQDARPPSAGGER